MSNQIYKDFFEEAMNQIQNEYIAQGKERDFKFYFNLEYIEDTFDTITISVPSDFMWKQMEKNGSAEKIQQKINELTAQEIKLIPVAKNGHIPQRKIEQPKQPQTIQQNTGDLFSFSDFSEQIQQLQKTTEIQKTQSSQNPQQHVGDLFGFSDFNDQIQQMNQPKENLINDISNTLPIQSQNLTQQKSQQTIQKSSLSRFQQTMANLDKMIEIEREKENQEKNQQLHQQNTHQIFSNQLFSNEPKKIENSGNPTLVSKTQYQSYNDYNEEYQRYLQTEVQKMQQKEIKANHPLLRDDYTFENFIPGVSTQYAYSASKRAAEAPGKEYNPMLIYGGVGLGKTHLMQSIGNYIYSKNPNAKICYISAEAFTNDFTASIRSQKTEEFKKKYRNLDVLLLDDIQFLEGKEGTQEELFHTFNAIYDRKGQLVFTCDRPISEIQKITDRLRTRFSRGLNIDLQPPDYETRRAILEQKINSKGKSIPLDVLDFIAQNVQSNVRDLESCMMKMIGYSELIEQELTIEIAKDLLRDRISEKEELGTVSAESIQNAVVKYYGLKLAELIGKKKSKQYVLPRQIAIYLCRNLLSEYSLKDIGNEFGGRDHTTVISAIERIELLIKTNEEVARVVKQIEKEAREIK